MDVIPDTASHLLLRLEATNQRDQREATKRKILERAAKSKARRADAEADQVEPSTPSVPAVEAKHNTNVAQHSSDMAIKVTLKRLQAVDWNGGSRADHFVEVFRDRVRYASGIGWLCWDGVRWNAVEGEARAIQFARQLYRECRRVAKTAERKERDRLIKCTLRADEANAIASMLALASSDASIRVQPSAFDAHDPILACANGYIDLKTGKLSKPDPAKLITRKAQTNYDPKAKCPRWEKAVHAWLEGDNAMIRYFQTAMGYSLTAACDLRAIFFVVGPPHTGKTAALETLSYVLGADGDGYSQMADPTTFMLSRTNRMRCDLPMLRAARLVTSSETAKRQRLNENFVKALTGREPIEAEQKFRDPIKFRPSFVIWISTNELPAADGSDRAFIERLHIINFESRQPPTPGFERHLRLEAQGILTWIVKGAEKYFAQHQQLHPPKAIERERNRYEKDMNPFRRFIDERCSLTQTARCAKSVLRDRYRTWCLDNDVEPLSNVKTALEKIGVTESKNNTMRFWKGVEIVDKI